MTMYVTLHKWFWFFFWDSTVRLFIYISIIMCYLYGQFLIEKFIKLMQDLIFRTPGSKKWCCKTSAMEYCTFIDDVHKNKDLCSNYGALWWRETKIFHSVYLSNDLFPPIITCSLSSFVQYIHGVVQAKFKIYLIKLKETTMVV